MNLVIVLSSACGLELKDRDRSESACPTRTTSSRSFRPAFLLQLIKGMAGGCGNDGGDKCTMTMKNRGQALL